jgi:hypothetical membrane protein
MNTTTISLLILLSVAVLLDLGAPLILGLRYPGYHQFKDTISALGIHGSPVQLASRIVLIIVGITLLIVGIGWAIRAYPLEWAFRLYIIGIIVFGLGTVLAGIFPEDIPNTPETYSGKIHGIASGLGFLLLLLNLLWAIWIPELRGIRWINVALLVLAACSFGLFLYSEKQTEGILRYTGFFQRINLLILYGALVFHYVWMHIPKKIDGE